MKKAISYLIIAAASVIAAGCATQPQISDQGFSRPGIVADRANKRVLLDAVGTEVVKESILEFLIIGKGSGHGYESAFITSAKPSDIKAALEYIGMKPGQAADYAKARLWPKGERVFCTVACPSNSFTPRRLETMVYNKQERRMMASTGFVFTGSRQVPPPDGSSATALAADVREPNSIISSYNEPDSILDVPRTAPQAIVYESMVLNPEFVPGEGRAVKLILEPEYKDGRLRVQDLLMQVSSVKPDSSSLGEVRVTLTDTDGRKLCDVAEISESVKVFQNLIEKGRDPFVKLTFSGDMTLSLIREVCSIYSALEQENGIRIDEPAAGALYFKAYIPEPKFRNRSDRMAQPWELYLTKDGGRISAGLIKIDEVWPEDDKITKPDLKEHKFRINKPEELKSALKENGPGLPVIILYASKDVTNGELLEYVLPVIDQYPNIHIFLD